MGEERSQDIILETSFENSFGEKDMQMKDMPCL